MKTKLKKQEQEEEVFAQLGKKNIKCEPHGVLLNSMVDLASHRKGKKKNKNKNKTIQ